MKFNVKKIISDVSKTVSKKANTIAKFGVKHAPTICTGVGIVGMGGTMYMVHKSSPKYHKIVEEEGGNKIETFAKVYWPSLLSFGASTGCIIAGNRISNKRYLALASAASLAQKELMNTQESILENFGPEALTTVRQKVAEKRSAEASLTETDVIKTGKGNDLYYEPLTNHYFRSSENELIKTVNELNSWLISDDEVCLDTLLVDWGVGSCELAKGIFFSTAKGYKHGSIDIDFTPTEAVIDGRKTLCWEIEYKNLPRGEYPFPW